jgi:hypothetical protein
MNASPAHADPDLDEGTPPIDTIAVRSPAIPVTLSELAALKGGALEVIEARVKVIHTLRVESIRATHPEDWLLFKAPDAQGGQVVGYLQDAGCDRVRDLWGIEVFDVSKPEKISGVDPAVFHYLVTGSGHCKLTRQTIEAIEGGRSSTDDFVKGKSGVELELLVRKAARANLDGNITRELAGMKSVPVDELRSAWTGTTKRIEACRLGRGFGTQDERHGATREGTPDVPPPVCPHCGTKGAYRPGKDGRAAFYGCPNYQKHADKKWIVDAAKWVAEQQRAASAAKPAPEAAPAAAPAAPATPPPSADEIFGRREPGQEG